MAHSSERVALRGQLHRLGLASDTPRQHTRLDDGRFAKLTTDGLALAFEFAYSTAFDAEITPDAAVEDAELCASLHGRMLLQWKVDYPPSVVATAAALLCRSGREIESAWDAFVELFEYWHGSYRDCPTDRLALAALLVGAMRDDEDIRDTENRGRETLAALAKVGFPRERETLWAASLLMREGQRPGSLEHVYDVWCGFVRAGWSMAATTYPYAARLSLVRGKPAEITSRVREIHELPAARVPVAEGRARLAAASILAHSDLHPPPDRSGARVPGSTSLAFEAFDTTLAALRRAADRRIPDGGDLDPLTPGALPLCDRCWHGRGTNHLFAFEACAAGRNEAFDPVTIFRFTSTGGPAWR